MEVSKLFTEQTWYSDAVELLLTDNEVRAKAKAIMLFGQTYFPSHFPNKHPEIHIELVMIMLADESKVLMEKYGKKFGKKVVALPRGHTKSTVVTFLLATFRLVFLDRKFIVIVSESEGKAIDFVKRIKDELEFNVQLITDFSGGKGYKTAEWAKSDFTTTTGVRVVGKGAGQSLRGMLHKSTRPDMILLDDIETTEQAGSDAIMNYLLSDVLPAVAENHEICYVGTIIRDGALLHKTLENEEWIGAKWEALVDDETKTMIAPDLLSYERYKSYENMYRGLGKMSVFFAEYHNNPLVADDGNTFNQDMFQDYEDNDDGNVYHWILYDPAMPPSGRTRLKSVDRSAIIVVATDSNQDWWIEEIHANRNAPKENYELIFRLAKKYKVTLRKVFMETISAQRAMYLNMKDMMKQLSVRFPFEEIPSHKGSKEARIEQLQPLYATGRIYHKKGQCLELEKELLLFGKTNHDDISDALSFGINRLKYPSKSARRVDRKRADAYDRMFAKAKAGANWKVI